MRMKWKLPVYSSGLLLAVAATAVSCSKESTAPTNSMTAATSAHVTQQKLEDLQAEYGWMGRFHTEGLAYIYTKLSESPRASRADKCRIVANALREFARNFSKGPGSKGIAAGVVFEQPCDRSSQLSINQQLQADINPEGLRPRGALSSAAVSLMDRMVSVFDSDASFSSTKAAIYNLQSIAAASLPAAEAGPVIGLGSIAISSANYWEVNYGVWSGNSLLQGAYSRLAPAPSPVATILTGPSSGRPRFGLSPFSKGVLKSDVSTGARILVAGALAGVFDLEAAAFGATGASAWTAITTFWKT